MELQHFSHNHPLVFHEEQIHEGDHKAYCNGCGELVLGPSFSCMMCEFHLDKSCAEAPLQINHPFHHNHMLDLLATSPEGGGSSSEDGGSSPEDGGRPSCNFCGKDCDNFMYHCSCNLNLHIKCALFSHNMAEQKVGDLQICPQITSSESQPRELQKANCFVCRKPLLDSSYLSHDSGFYLHEKCVQQPLEITHLSHRLHSLFLQFITTENLHACNMCQETQGEGLVYCCSICKFSLHIDCVSPPPVIEDRSCHEHPFIRFYRHTSYICDVCGMPGNCVSYICSTCSLTIHKKCISVPRFIKSAWHHHPLSHEYFVVDNECGLQRCIICHEVVEKNYGIYSCSQCKSFIHVNCILQLDPRWYDKIQSKDDYEKLSRSLKLALDMFYPSFSIIRDTKVGEKVINIEIKHFSHEHNLLHSDEVKIDRYCDGCSLLIVSSSYHCMQCEFCLHKSCAELSRKKQIWFHAPSGHTHHLLSSHIFQCSCCFLDCYGFAYKCEECWNAYCCVSCTELSLTWTNHGHQHPLLLYYKYRGQICNTCGKASEDLPVYRCMDCNFNVHSKCRFIIPSMVRHKCDEHNLTLIYHEDNDYSESYYCDICEERRNPNTWFYRCTVCDTSAHLTCAVVDYSFFKPGIKIFEESIHPHTLVTVKNKNAYQYPAKCSKCGLPCLELALECEKTRCNYIIHWKCSRRSIFY